MPPWPRSRSIRYLPAIRSPGLSAAMRLDYTRDRRLRPGAALRSHLSEGAVVLTVDLTEIRTVGRVHPLAARLLFALHRCVDRDLGRRRRHAARIGARRFFAREDSLPAS